MLTFIYMVFNETGKELLEGNSLELENDNEILDFEKQMVEEYTNRDIFNGTCLTIAHKFAKISMKKDKNGVLLCNTRKEQAVC